MAGNTKGTPTNIDIAVGARVRLLRREQHISQTGLARAIGMTFQQVQKYEQGRNRISASVLVRIAAALQTTGGHLLGEDDGPGAPPGPKHASAVAAAGAPELLNAYAAIKSRTTQHAIVRIVQAIAEAERLAPARAFLDTPQPDPALLNSYIATGNSTLVTTAHSTDLAGDPSLGAVTISTSGRMWEEAPTSSDLGAVHPDKQNARESERIA